jgi:predicted choloylglycine hydrolase
LLELTFSGSYFKIGKAFGGAVKGIIPSPEPKPALRDFTLQCETLVKDYAPGLLDELKGYAEGVEFDYEEILASYLIPHVMQSCNVFCIAGEHAQDGYPIFARHMDWMAADQKFARLLQTSPHGAMMSLNFNFCDVGCYGGINEAGLAIGSASIPFFKGKPEPGLKENIATRWILDTFTKTRDAVAYLERIPHAHACAYLVADKRGVIARVDASPQRCASEFFEYGIGIVCNFFTHPTMQKLDTMPKNDRAYTYHKRITQWFEKHRGNITLRQIEALCQDHDNGICEHLDDPPGGTLWSWIAQLGTHRLEYLAGFPCKNEYQIRKITNS